MVDRFSILDILNASYDGDDLLKVSVGSNTIPSDLIYQMVDTTGDGTGTVEMSTTAAVYKVAPPSGYIYSLSRINIYIEDNAKMTGDKYGGDSALSNGIVVSVENAGGTIKTLTPVPITKNFEWGLQAGVDVFLTDVATGNDVILIRWTFSRGGGPILLNGTSGEFLKFNIQDSLANLVSHMAQVQGSQKEIV